MNVNGMLHALTALVTSQTATMNGLSAGLAANTSALAELTKAVATGGNGTGNQALLDAVSQMSTAQHQMQGALDSVAGTLSALQAQVIKDLEVDDSVSPGPAPAPAVAPSPAPAPDVAPSPAPGPDVAPAPNPPAPNPPVGA